MEELLVSLGIVSTAESLLYVGSAVDWLHNKTIVTVDTEHPDNIPASVKLFILKYLDLMKISTGVASESISGLSQSFVTNQSLEAKIYDLAIGILGSDVLKSTVTVHSGEDCWDYGC